LAGCLAEDVLDDGGGMTESETKLTSRRPQDRRNVRLAIPGLTTLEVDHLLDGTRVYPAQLAWRRDRTAAAAVPLLSGALGVLLLLSSFFPLRSVASMPSTVGAVITAVTGVALLIAAVALGRRRSGETNVHAAGLAVLLITALALAAAMLTSGTLAQTAYFQILVVVAGAAMLRPGWFTAALGGTWALWLGVTAALTATTDAAGWLLAMLAATVMAVVIHTMRTDALRALGGALVAAENEAVRDPLTGLLNRRGFRVVGSEVLALARRSREPLSCTFIDIDGLKAVNDVLGHEAGDEVIRTTGDALVGVFRQADVVARIGGDEFVVLSLGAGPRVEEVERRLQDRLATSAFAQSRRSTPAVSAGRVVHLPWQDEELDTITERADQEMYRRRRLRRAQSGDRDAPW
jgi:diguanylate cyclase (GGDEF)-like protein